MKANRKTRPQPSLASLTMDEYHQLAEMVCTRTYEDVRQQINKPRSQGGFDLNISIRPLQVLHARVHRLNKINEKLATGEKLTLTAYDEIHAGEKRAPEEIHDAILDATYQLVTEHDNTPHQLLALQRLADFPERADIRVAKEQRAEEMHLHKTTMELRKEAHKVQMDLRKFEHKLDMDTFRKHIATERLKLAEQKLKIREEQLKRAALSPGTNSSRVKPSPYPPGEDALGPIPKSLNDCEAISARVRKQFGITPEEAARRADLQKKFDSGELKLPEHCGMLDTPTAPSSSNGGTSSTSPTSISRDATTPVTAAPADLYPSKIHNTGGTRSPSPTSISRDATTPTNATSADLYPSEIHNTGGTQPQSGSSLNRTDLGVASTSPTSTSRDATAPTRATPADLSATDVDESQAQNPELTTQNSPSPETVAEAVDRYTVTRAREYIAHSQKYTPWPHRHSPPEYITEHRHCPCGQPSPCPTHEAEAFGPFPEIFWKISPFSPDYAACLRDRNLPFREPKEFLP